MKIRDVIKKMELKYSQIQCNCFKKLYIFETVEELVLMFYTSIQDYYDYKSSFKSIYTKQYNFCNVNVCHSFYYSTEYDDDYDDENDFLSLLKNTE